MYTRILDMGIVACLSPREVGAGIRLQRLAPRVIGLRMKSIAPSRCTEALKESPPDEDNDDEGQATNRSVLRVVSNSTYHDAMVVCVCGLPASAIAPN